MNIITEVKILDIFGNKNNDINYERNIWDRYIINYLITLPKECPLCKYNIVNLQAYESINNPYICRCCNGKCRKLIYLKDNSIFGYFPRTLASSLLFILKL